MKGRNAVADEDDHFLFLIRLHLRIKKKLLCPPESGRIICKSGCALIWKADSVICTCKGRSVRGEDFTVPAARVRVVQNDSGAPRFIYPRPVISSARTFKTDSRPLIILIHVQEFGNHTAPAVQGILNSTGTMGIPLIVLVIHTA